MQFDGSRASPAEITKDYILRRVSEESIMEYYLQIPIKLGAMIRSPIRKDINPTCNFSYYRGRLRMRDWTELRAYDCFDIVRIKHNCNYGEALHIIANDFNIMSLRADSNLQEKINKLLQTENKEKKLIQVKIQEFTSVDLNYLSQYGITQEIAEYFKCYSIKYLWIEGKALYQYSEEDPILGYYLGNAINGEERWKIYFPFRPRSDRKRPRFICNTNRINGWVQIPHEGDHLVLTKSMKDVMTLYRLGITSIAMQNEATLIYKYIVDELRDRFENIFSLYDFDRPGVRMARLLRKAYNIQPFFLTNGKFNSQNYEAKDISDYVKNNGVYKAQKLIHSIRDSYGD